ncbi:copper homeostasis protein CutC [Aureitalea sp. L0-47]|uniref:copper homeostasis protein CutC n=1 Tax=Aureitalea sp. L0-47 TaxID=2816962 RepID=UPI0022376267|nr:copper homeostasis protein CutC [Aureitalea sp. L0-47]MCW5520919.1 copper homeostasis protein CutC [Aureitalea sp. L0-47]
MIVEICASNFESARIAQECGADRIELCTDLGVGGLTPSRESIQKVTTELDIPINVLVRPRKGNFVYSEVEFHEMLDTIEFCRELNCAGVVSGVLTQENEIDFERTKHLVKASEGMEFTFHRAFDEVADPISALNSLIALGVDRLLSSGLELNAADGIPLLKQLQEHSAGRIEIMPGAGINETNAQLFKVAGFQSIHLSAIKKGIAINSMFETGVEGVSDSEIIKKVITIVR